MFRFDSNVAAAASIHQQAAAIHEMFLRENPENLSLLPAAIQQWENLAAIREQLAHLRAAIAAQRRAIELSDRLIAAEPDSVDHGLKCASRRT